MVDTPDIEIGLRNHNDEQGLQKTNSLTIQNNEKMANSLMLDTKMKSDTHYNPNEHKKLIEKKINAMDAKKF